MPAKCLYNTGWLYSISVDSRRVVTASQPSVSANVRAVEALVNKGKLQPGRAVFVHGCLGGVGRAAVQIALTRAAAIVGGSCRVGAMQDARDLGVAPVVEFGSLPTTLKGQFDIVLDTVGTLSPRASRMLLKRGGRIVDIVPSAGKFIRSVLPGPYQVMIAEHSAKDLEELARACAEGVLRLPIAQTVSLSDAIAALTELEHDNRPKGGKLIITAS